MNGDSGSERRSKTRALLGFGEFRKKEKKKYRERERKKKEREREKREMERFIKGLRVSE